MKKLIFIAVLSVFAFSNLIAQDGESIDGPTQKGKFVFSGATGLQFVSSNIEYEYDGEPYGDYDINSFSFMPGVGYFVIDNLAIGISANFTSITEKNEGEKYTISSTMILPTLLYYFPVEGQFKPLVQVGAGLMSTKEKDEEREAFEEVFKMSGLAVSFGGGASYFINNYVSLNFGLSYTIANLKDSDDSDLKQKQNNLGANIGFAIFL